MSQGVKLEYTARVWLHSLLYITYCVTEFYNISSSETFFVALFRHRKIGSNPARRSIDLDMSQPLPTVGRDCDWTRAGLKKHGGGRFAEDPIRR